MTKRTYRNKSKMTKIPVLPLRDTVIYPDHSCSLYVARPKSIMALEKAASSDTDIALFAQRSPEVENPKEEDLHTYGSVAKVLQILRMSGDTIKALVEAKARVIRVKMVDHEFPVADVVIDHPNEDYNHDKFVDIRTNIVHSFESLNESSNEEKSEANQETASALMAAKTPRILTELLASYLDFSVDKKQSILESKDCMLPLKAISRMLDTRVEMKQTDSVIRGRVKNQMERGQREYYLNEQLKAIRKELGELSGQKSNGDELSEKIAKVPLSDEARAKAESEVAKLEKMPPMAAEATVIHSYMDTLLSLPWQARSKISSDLVKAQTVLDKNHFGLNEVKNRILEYLAVFKRVDRLNGPILCLVGAPGVGKSALGRSIATAVGREFARISLGGMHDEAEIRGHRRTYIGSMPGKIIQNLIKVKKMNPVFLLDEIDKLSSDFRGDPASSLLEVLDPEQNQNFSDHYLEVGFDLSEVMFVATANTLQIPAPLLDRMEKIHIPGYIEDEKLQIALLHLIPRLMKAHGLKKRELVFNEEVIMQLIRRYTREAGVRELERMLARICRKAVRFLCQGSESQIKLSVRKNAKSIRLKLDELPELIGLPKYKYKEKGNDARVGQVMGMAWTEAGGDLLNIEATMIPGKGKVSYTGSLGKVMQESIEAAMVLVRTRAEHYRIPSKLFQENDFHIHVPEGATPKDGPSAGSAISLAVLSCIMNAPVSYDLALTGEITLRGSVLAIGGLREKLTAAVRGGVGRVIIPDENFSDLSEIPDNIKNRLKIIPVKNIGEVFEEGLEIESKDSDLFAENWIGGRLISDKTTRSGGVVNH